MSFRNFVNKQKPLITVVSLILVGVAIYTSFSTLKGTPRGEIQTRAYYTTDDGKTWFVDDVNKAPPFETADGKIAVGAVIVSCQGGKNPFPLYLWRYSEEAKKALEQNRTVDLTYMRELKKPGDSQWVSMRDMVRASALQSVSCPPGQSDYVELIP